MSSDRPESRKPTDDRLLRWIVELERERDLLLKVIQIAVSGELLTDGPTGELAMVDVALLDALKGMSPLTADTVASLVRFAAEHEEMSAGLHAFNAILGRAASRVGDGRLARTFNEIPPSPIEALDDE